MIDIEQLNDVPNLTPLPYPMSFAEEYMLYYVKSGRALSSSDLDSDSVQYAYVFKKSDNSLVGSIRRPYKTPGKGWVFYKFLSSNELLHLNEMILSGKVQVTFNL